MIEGEHVNIQLTPNEARVIGVLIEKEIATPEQYPLSLNALTNACNQKSNRDPVLQLDEVTVQEIVDGLVKRHMVSAKTGFGSRVTKYHHRFCNSQFGALKFSPHELAIVCELLLRGAQTPGELRGHGDRLCKFGDVHVVESVLKGLGEREDGPFVTRLPREAGKRESRYAHLFSGEVHPADTPTISHDADGLGASDRERLAHVERRVGELGQELNRLKSELEQLRGMMASGNADDEGRP